MSQSVASHAAPSTTSEDYMWLEEIAKRLKVKERTVIDLHKREGLPLRKLTTRGPFYGFWSEVEPWLKRKS